MHSPPRRGGALHKKCLMSGSPAVAAILDFLCAKLRGGELHREDRGKRHDGFPKGFQTQVFVFAVLIVVEIHHWDRDDRKAESFGKWSHRDRAAHRSDANRHLVPRRLDDIRDFSAGGVRYGLPFFFEPPSAALHLRGPLLAHSWSPCF